MWGFDALAVENAEEILETNKSPGTISQHELTQNIANLMVICGVPEITGKSVTDLFTRIRMLELLDEKPSIHIPAADGGSPSPFTITHEMLVRRTGLKVAVKAETWKQWSKRQGETAYDILRNDLQRKLLTGEET